MNPHHPPPGCERHLEIEGSSDGLKQAAQRIREQLQAWHVDERTAYIADLATDEILNNIIHHAWTDQTTRTIGIGLSLMHDTLTLTFSDDGQAFDPTSATPLTQSADIDEARVGGRGLLMLRRMASDLRYERRDNKNHFSVVIKRPG